KYSNVSVNGFTLSSFSYGIYLNQTTSSSVTLNNVTKMAMSGIALNRSSNNLILNNTVSSAASTNGGINLYKGGNNKVIGDVIINNAFFGLVSNSTNNTYQKDVFTKNPTDVYCPFLNSSFKISNLFGSSTCSTNSYCNFAQCTTTNLPSQVSSFVLSPPAIGSCGGIKVGGTYTLSNDLNMKNYLNTSNPLSSSQ
ncbi:MAG: right-handed parallel beta-helix repeat-containing protein, partial [Candidatus Micrarchaeota archaeon]|nr:right-handed parallel beta-helix repeat-containing protein [Candidatus Micrarchaeota archaeon]